MKAYDQHRVQSLLQDSLTAEASDIIVKVPGRPMFRSGGRLIATPYAPLSTEDTFQFARSLLLLARIERPLAHIQNETFSFGLHRIGRFRAHLYRQRGSIAIVIHRISLLPPTLTAISAPENTAAITWGGPGLTLVTGQKQRLRLMAALVDGYNRTNVGHLVSIEDPIEYLHRDKQALISQREIGEDTESAQLALQDVLRESPDAVVVHDLPDWQTAEAALRAAESGLSVVAGLAGCRAIEATRWFGRMFSSHRETEINERLCVVLRGVIAEHQGSVHALPVSPPVREAIIKRRPLPITKTPPS